MAWRELFRLFVRRVRMLWGCKNVIVGRLTALPIALSFSHGPTTSVTVVFLVDYLF